MKTARRVSNGNWSFGIAPGGLPLLGHAFLLARRPLDFLASLPAHGDLVELRLGPRLAYLPCHPDLVQRILLDSRVFDSGGPLKDKARPILGNGLITADREEHLRQRRMIQPVFSASRMASYAEIMRDECDAEARSWRPGGTLDLQDAMHSLTARVTGRALFSTDIAPHAVAEIQRCLPIVVHGAYRRALDPTGLLEKLPTPSSRAFRQALVRLHRLIDGIVDGYRRSGREHGDLLSALLAARDTETGEALDDQEVHDQVMTLLLAGVETTAGALAWALHLVGGRPEVEERLHQEVDDVLGGRLPRFDDLSRLEYTRRVFTETLRMYPPAWMFTRVTTAEVEIAGHRLPAGADVLISPYVLHHDPRLFPDPGRFDPDRWLPERAGTIPRGAMLPFGAGSRKCIGDVFGMTEAVLALAAITSRWRLRARPGTCVRPRVGMSLGTGPLPMVTEPRGR